MKTDQVIASLLEDDFDGIGDMKEMETEDQFIVVFSKPGFHPSYLKDNKPYAIWTIDRSEAQRFNREELQNTLNSLYSRIDKSRLKTERVMESDDFEDDIGDMKDLEGEPNRFADIERMLRDGTLYLSGEVNRNSRYSHQRSTTLTITDDFQWNTRTQGMTDEEFKAQEAEEIRVGGLINDLDAAITARMIDWNNKIYKELYDEWAYSLSDEVVAGTIEANEYEFNENGDRQDGTGIQYEQLENHAKERAREWYVNGSSSDNYFAEHIIEEWTKLLEDKGFGGVEIAYSVGSGQGDGASFTAKSLDFIQYFNAPDPLDISELDRGGAVQESDEDDLGDMKDLYLVSDPDVEMEEWLKSYMPKLGFTQNERGIGSSKPSGREWTKTRGETKVDIGDSTTHGKMLVVTYSSRDGGRHWQNNDMRVLAPGSPLIDYLKSVRFVRPDVAARLAESEEDDDIGDMKDLEIEPPPTPTSLFMVAEYIMQGLKEAGAEMLHLTHGTEHPDRLFIHGELRDKYKPTVATVIKAADAHAHSPLISAMQYTVSNYQPRTVYRRYFAIAIEPVRKQEPAQLPESDEEDIGDMKEMDGVELPKVFGYVLRSAMKDSHYPWMGSRYSDRPGCNGDWRQYLGDAKVFKRFSTTTQWPDLEAVPLYSDPRRTGNNALNPFYVHKKYDFSKLPPRGMDVDESEEDDDIGDMKDLESTMPKGAAYIRYTYDPIDDPEYPPAWEWQGPFCTVEGAQSWAREEFMQYRKDATAVEIVVIEKGVVLDRCAVDNDYDLVRTAPLHQDAPISESTQVLTEGYKERAALFIRQGEDEATVTLFLDMHRKLKDRRLITGTDADIDSFTDFEQLRVVVDAAEEVRKQREEEKKKRDREAPTVYENEYVIIVNPLTIAASQRYGAGTRWCISALNNNYFESYTSHGEKFYFTLSKTKGADDPTYKIAAQIKENGTINGFWNAPDNSISLATYERATGIDTSTWRAYDTESLKRDPFKAYKFMVNVAGKKVPELEPVIASNPQTAYHYAKQFEARFPLGEPAILRHAGWSVEYARDIIGGRWPEAEPRIMTIPNLALEYALTVIKGRWPEAEPYIAKDMDDAKIYSERISNKIRDHISNTLDFDLYERLRNNTALQHSY